jgi:hypothetical protein
VPGKQGCSEPTLPGPARPDKSDWDVNYVAMRLAGMKPAGPGSVLSQAIGRARARPWLGWASVVDRQDAPARPA